MAKIIPAEYAVGAKAFGDATKKRATAQARAAAVLTTSFVETDEIEVTHYEYAGIFFQVTEGGLTSFEYIIWQSADGATYCRIGAETVTPTVITDSTPPYSRALPSDNWYKIVPVPGRYIKLQVRGVGTPTGSSCAIDISGVR